MSRNRDEVHLKAAALAALTQRALKLHLRVTQFSAATARAAIDLAVNDNSHANTMLDGDDDEIVDVARNAKEVLCFRDQVRVIVDKDRAG